MWCPATARCSLQFYLFWSICPPSEGRRRGPKLQRRSCGRLEAFLNSGPPSFGSFPSAARLFPPPFFARRGFRGFGIPAELLDERMGTPCEGPVVEPLTYGRFRLSNDSLSLTSTVTLVTDEKRATGEICLILVDSGMASQRMAVLRGLSAVGVLPEYVNQLVLTHMDLDTVGNLNLFPQANVFVGNRRALKDTVFFPKAAPLFDQKLGELPFTQLCDNTFLYLTPGFTNEDVSLLVRNVSGFGNIALSGELQ